MAPNRFPIATDTPTHYSFMGQLGGAANVWQPADASLTRPNNATAYASTNAIGSATSTLFTFTKFFRMPQSSGLLDGARLVASVASIATSNMGSITAHLYKAAPTGNPNADQSAFKTLFADDANKLGTISFSSWAIGGTGSDTIESYGSLSPSPMPIMAAANAQELYAVLMAAGAFTPIALAQIQLYLSAVLD